MKLNTCTGRWENIPHAPPSIFRPKIRASQRAFSLRLHRKLSSCGTLSPPIIAGQSNGIRRSAGHQGMDAPSYGQKRLVS